MAINTQSDREDEKDLDGFRMPAIANSKVKCARAILWTKWFIIAIGCCCFIYADEDLQHGCQHQKISNKLAIKAPPVVILII